MPSFSTAPLVLASMLKISVRGGRGEIEERKMGHLSNSQGFHILIVPPAWTVL